MKNPLPLMPAILLLGIGLVLVSDSQVYSPGAIVGVAHAESTASALKSLRVPMFRMGVSSNNIGTEGNLFYGEAPDPATGTAPLFANDLTTRRVVHIDPAHENIDDTNQTWKPGLVEVNIPPQDAPPLLQPGVRFEDVTSASGLGALLSDTYIHTSSWVMLESLRID